MIYKKPPTYSISAALIKGVIIMCDISNALYEIAIEEYLSYMGVL